MHMKEYDLASPGKALATLNLLLDVSGINKVQAKIDATLLPEWKNTRAYEAEVLVPKGTQLDIGKVAPQTIESTGTVLDGLSDQLLMPQNWPKEWIQNIRNVKS